ncbi:hypothetical protein C8J57DRAFT_1232290 [Mycena rebaudengoi]|nr:hypothetical protein C8J57DRAFT_1232290 [Mycena rebaudengoi]
MASMDSNVERHSPINMSGGMKMCGIMTLYWAKNRSKRRWRRELGIDEDSTCQKVHLMLNITWHILPFPSTTTTTIAPAQGIGGIAGNVRRHPRQSFLHRGIGGVVFYSAWQSHFYGKRLFWYSMACVMRGLGKTRGEAQRTGTGRVDIVGTGVTLESIASAHHIAPRCGRRLRRAAATWRRRASGSRLSA